MDTIKAEQLGTTKWRVLAIPFGGPFKGKDFDGEFFDRDTDVKPRWFRERPVIFHHGMDRTIKDADLGVQELDEEPSDEGWWGTVWLDRSARYWAQVNELLRAGKMYGSSGAIAHLVRKDHKTGEILVWPHAEQTITLTPANPYARITASKAVADLSAIAADLRPDLSRPAAAATDGEDAAMKRALTIERINRLALATRTIR